MKYEDLRFYLYRPKRSFGQGNSFTPVCHSVHRGGGSGPGGGFLTRTPHPGPDPPRPDPPRTRTYPPGTRPPPPGSRLRNTVNDRPVRILLEYILVCSMRLQLPIKQAQKFEVSRNFSDAVKPTIYDYHLVTLFTVVTYRWWGGYPKDLLTGGWKAIGLRMSGGMGRGKEVTLPCHLSHDACDVPTPPVDRMMDRMWKHYLPQLCWREVIIMVTFLGDIYTHNPSSLRICATILPENCGFAWSWTTERMQSIVTISLLFLVLFRQLWARGSLSLKEDYKTYFAVEFSPYQEDRRHSMQTYFPKTGKNYRRKKFNFW